MATVRRLVTELAYKVDRSGLREYKLAAEKAAKQIRESINGAKVAQGRLNKEFAEGLNTIRRMTAAMRVFIRRLDEAVRKAVELRAVLGKVTQTVLRSARGMKIFAKSSHEAARGWRRIDGVVKSTSKSISFMERKVNSMMMMLGAGAGLGGGLLAALAAFQMDRFTRARARTRVVLGDRNVNAEFQQIQGIAQQTGQLVVPTANLYRRLQRSQGAQTGQITSLLTQAVVAGGGNLLDAKSRMQDVAQALSKGFFDKSDVENMFEDTPLLARILADAYGIDPRNLVGAAEARENGLGTTRFLDELISRTDDLQRRLNRMPKQFRQGIVVVIDAFGAYVDFLNRAFGISNGFFRVSQAIANNIDTIVKALMIVAASGFWVAAAKFFGKYGKFMLPFLSRWLKVATVIYGIYLIGQDILIWLMGGQSILGEIIGNVEQWRGVLNQIQSIFQTIVHWLGLGQVDLLAWLSAGFALFAVFLAISKVVSTTAKTVAAIAAASRAVGMGAKAVGRGAGGAAIGAAGILAKVARMGSGIALALTPSQLGDSTLDAYRASHPNWSMEPTAEKLGGAADRQIQAAERQIQAAAAMEAASRNNGGGVLTIPIDTSVEAAP